MHGVARLTEDYANSDAPYRRVLEAGMAEEGSAIHRVRLSGPLDLSSLAGLLDGVREAVRAAPEARHVVWVEADRPTASCATRLGLVMADIALETEARGLVAVLDERTMPRGGALVAQLATGRMALPAGSVIDAATWAAPMARPHRAACAERLVRAAGTRMPNAALLAAVPWQALRAALMRSPFVDLLQGERRSIDRLDVDDSRLFDVLCRAGLVDRDGPNATSAFRSISYDGLLVLSDPDVPDGLQGPAYLDPLWEAPTLCRLFPTQPVARALDVGCGAGLTSLVLARRARHVLATDLNPRALGVTEVNCVVNGVANVERRSGDLLAPAAGALFDAVVFNSPTDQEGGCGESLLMAGGAVLDRFLQGLGGVLAETGWALVNLAVAADDRDDILCRAARALGAKAAARDLAFVEASERCAASGVRRGLLLVAPGRGRSRHIVLDYHGVGAPIRFPGSLSLESWLAAIGEVV